MKFMITILLFVSGSFASAALSGAQETAKPGVYWVPVGQQLSQFALFNISKVSVKIGEDKVAVEYELPHELTGAANKIELEGPLQKSGPVVLQGDYGRMECPTPTDFSDCAVSYRDLNFDAEARTALLASISSNDEELRKRELVAARFQFGGEPHGFLRVLNGQPEIPKY